MYANAPLCLTCQYFRGMPSVPGGKAKCEVKARGIPEKTFWEGGRCSSYKRVK